MTRHIIGSFNVVFSGEHWRLPVLAAIILLSGFHLQAQPLLRNSLSTNNLSTNLVWNPSTYEFRLSGPSPSVTWWNTSGSANAKRFELTDTSGQLRFSTTTDNGGATTLLTSLATDGNLAPLSLSLSGTTNRLTVSSTNTLLLDGVPVVAGGAGVTNTTINVITINATTNIYNVGQGGKLNITTNFTIQTNASLTISNLARPSILMVGGDGNATNATLSGLTLSGTTLSASAGGDTTFSNIVTLTQTTTNVSQMDFSLVQGGGAFKLVLTGNAYMPAPANVATSPFSKAWLFIQQPSTGTCLITWSNIYAWSQGAAPILDTNNNSVSIIEFVGDLFTNGVVHGSATALSRRP